MPVAVEVGRSVQRHQIQLPWAMASMLRVSSSKMAARKLGGTAALSTGLVTLAGGRLIPSLFDNMHISGRLRASDPPNNAA
jgi:hypothetical protein